MLSSTLPPLHCSLLLDTSVPVFASSLTEEVRHKFAFTPSEITAMASACPSP